VCGQRRANKNKNTCVAFAEKNKDTQHGKMFFTKMLFLKFYVDMNMNKYAYATMAICMVLLPIAQ